MQHLFGNNYSTILTVLLLFLVSISHAQLKRERVVQDQEVELTFDAPRLINLYTTEPLNKNDLHWSIMHTFGELNNGIQNLWGIDNGANIRLSFEYAPSNKFSITAARSSLDKVYDLGIRNHYLIQKKDNSMPVSVSSMFSVAVNTNNYKFLDNEAPAFNERLSFVGQLMISRKFTKKLSMQLSPMYAYFVDNRAIYLTKSKDQHHPALAYSIKYTAFGKYSFTAQSIIDLDSPENSNVGFGIDIETGGHVFQLYVVSAANLNDSYLLADEVDRPFQSLRFGFNVNRIFTLGKSKK